MAKHDKLIERFWAKVEKTNFCWNWRGYCNKRGGHGEFTTKVRGKYRKIYAHRFSYVLATNHNPKKNFVLHACDNARCVNPNHLYLGNHYLNMRDMKFMERSSKRKGELNGRVKISAKDVQFIRKSKSSPKKLAKEYGIGRATISKIRLRQRWAHL